MSKARSVIFVTHQFFSHAVPEKLQYLFLRQAINRSAAALIDQVSYIECHRMRVLHFAIQARLRDKAPLACHIRSRYPRAYGEHRFQMIWPRRHRP
jgi:hypothetical protein